MMRIAAGVFAVLAGLSPASAQEVWRLPVEQATCVMDNIETYLESSEPILVIVAAACPEVDPTKALSSLAVNSAVPSFDVTEDGQDVDSIVVYSAAALACLKRASIEFGGPVVHLPKSPTC